MCRAASLLAALVSSAAATAQPVDVLGYFLNTTPACPAEGACNGGRTAVAAQPCLGGTGYMSFATTVYCGPGSRELYFIRKGAEARPWSVESYFVAGGFILGLDEVGFASTGGILRQRVFRDRATRRKGFRVLPVVLDDGFRFVPDPYVEEQWYSRGAPACWGDEVRDVRSGSVHETWVRIEQAKEFLFDCRGIDLATTAVTRCAGPYDVELVTKEDRWGRIPDVERYSYGRWLDPRTGRKEGLGIVHWEHRTADGLEVVVSNHLVNASYEGLPCWTCPDP